METKEITIMQQVEDLAVKSGTPFEFAVDELTKLAERGAAITSVDDPAFKEVKAEMVSKRNYIKNYCLDARREIKKVAEGVTDVEKILYEIFVPEEDRLAEMAKADKEQKEREERLEMLPRWKEELATIGDEVEILDEELLKMKPKDFVQYKIDRQTAKIEADKAEIEKARLAQEEEKKRLEWEAGAQERERQAREEEQKKQEEEKQREKEATVTRRKNALQNFGLVYVTDTDSYEFGQDQRFIETQYMVSIQELTDMTEEKWTELHTELSTDFNHRLKAAEDEKIAAEEAEKKAKRERADRYKEFRASHGFTEENHEDYYEKVITENGVDTKVVLFKKVGEFDLTEAV